MNLGKFLGLNRDLPIVAGDMFAGAGAGSGSDYEHPVLALPQLSALVGTGEVGDNPINAISPRLVTLVPEANVVGAATNNYTWNILHRRAGALLVSTNAPTTIGGAGVATVTPASMVNIVPGAQLVFSGGSGAAETVTVLSTTATTFSANFANGHSGGYTITSAPLATVTYANGTNETAYVPHQFTLPAGVVLLPGDILTLQRVTNGTGLASPAVYTQVEFVLAQIPVGRA